MTASTQRTIPELRQAEDDARAKLISFQPAVVQAFADHLPGRVESFARKMALAQPDAALALGPEGTQKLRAELRSIADEILQDIRRAGESDEWIGTTTHVDVSNFHATLHAAINKHLDKIPQAIEANGLNPALQSALAGVKPLVISDLLFAYDTGFREAFSAAASELGKIRRDTEAAIAEAKRAAVVDLWSQ